MFPLLPMLANLLRVFQALARVFQAVARVFQALARTSSSVESFLGQGSKGGYSGKPFLTIHVKGLAELNKFLETFPEQMQKRAMRGGLRAGMNVVKSAAQQNINSVSGQLAKGLKVSTRSRGSTVTASLKATGPHSHVATWIEFGTKAHIIEAKAGKALRLAGGKVVHAVRHPGAKPRPFMRPALDGQAAAAVDATAAYIKERLDTEDWRRGGTFSADNES